MGRIESVNAGRAAPLQAGGRTVRSAIVKTPVAGPVAVGPLGLDGDEQADRRVHGGPHQAVYAYARESYEWWQAELGRVLAPAILGENLTTSGVDVDGAHVGERWRAGSVVFEVTAPRIPCAKLAARIGDPGFVKRFARAQRPGAYLRVLEPGTLAAGDGIDVVERPNHGVTIALVRTAYLDDHSLAPRLLDAPQLPPRMLAWARERAR